MKKKIAVALILLFIVIGFLFLSTGGKRTDIMLMDYSISEDSKTLTMNIAVASSMGYVRTLKVRQDGDKKYITFYNTYGINSSIGARNRFQVELNPSCKEIYFDRGDKGYKLVLQKEEKTNEWQLAR